MVVNDQGGKVHMSVISPAGLLEMHPDPLGVQAMVVKDQGGKVHVCHQPSRSLGDASWPSGGSGLALLSELREQQSSKGTFSSPGCGQLGRTR